MNSVTIKHLSINEKLVFQVSLATKEEDIVTMLYKTKNRTTPSPTAAKKNNKASDGTRKYVLPPFVKEIINITIA